MKKYTQPELSVLNMSSPDIITTSVDTYNDCEYTPWDSLFGE